MFNCRSLISIFKRRLRTLVRDESGQGLVEFAVVLPILLLLTVGTIMLTLSYIQKARMNGLAFMSARVAAVRRPNVDAAAYTLQQYRERTGQNWLQEITVQPQPTGPNEVGIRLSKPGERVDVFANLVSGQQNQQPMNLVVQMQLPKESTETGSLRRQTYSEVDYQYEPLGIGELISNLPQGLLNTTQMADSASPSDFGARDKLLGLEPPDTNLKKFYDDHNWNNAFSSNDEAAAGQFASMQTTYKTFVLIEQGGSLLQLIANFSGFGKALMDVLELVGAEAADAMEKSMDRVSDGVDQNVRNSYR